MDERKAGGHEQVVTSLMDLQARLRGEEPEERHEEPPEGRHQEPPPAEAFVTAPPATEDVVRLPEAGEAPVVPVEETAGRPVPEPEPPAVEMPPAPSPIVPVEVATNEVGQPAPEDLERFAPVTPLRAGLGGEDRLAGIVERVAELEGSIDDVSRRVDGRVAERTDRLVSLEQRLLHEIASQRRDLLAAIDDRFVVLDRALREGLAALHAAVPDEPNDAGEPA